MTSIRKAALACVTATLVALPLSAAAQTGPRNQDTYFTFSQDVELPNKTLPAGKYFFQLLDSDSNRHIVKVMSEDRKELHATLMAIPYYTNDRPSDEPQVRFMETPASGSNGTNAAQATNAIKIWFYPGNSVGHEFIYPRSQAMRLASRTGGSVLTTKSETEVTETVADADLTRVDRAGADSAVDMSNRAETTTAATQPPAAPEPMPAPTQTAQTQPTQTTPAPAPMPERTAAPAPMPERTTRSELPSTAGFLPLLAVIGIGSLVGNRLLRRARRA